MLNDEQRQRLSELRERQYTGSATEAERDELAALMHQVKAAEAAALGPANVRRDREIADLAAEVERLEAQNSGLREYLRERQEFLARARSLVAQLRAEDRRIRERHRDALGSVSVRADGVQTGVP